MSRAWVVAMVVAGVACKKGAPEPDPGAGSSAPSSAGADADATHATTSAMTSTSAGATPSANSGAITAAITAADATLSSCTRSDRVLLPNADAAILRAHCGADDVVLLVGAKKTKRLKSSVLEVEPSVHGFWTPLGATPKLVAVWAPPQTQLYTFADGAFLDDAPLTIPWRLTPAAQIDADGDGAPELVVPLWKLPLGVAPNACNDAQRSWIETDATGAKLDVDGLASWDASKNAFVTTRAKFRSWYAMRLSAARSLAKHAAATDGGVCIVEGLRTAAEIALYGRLLGEPASAVDAEADAVASKWPEWRGMRAQIPLQNVPNLAGSP